jgi:hypothetical protein
MLDNFWFAADFTRHNVHREPLAPLLPN